MRLLGSWLQWVVAHEVIGIARSSLSCFAPDFVCLRRLVLRARKTLRIHPSGSGIHERSLRSGNALAERLASGIGNRRSPASTAGLKAVHPYRDSGYSRVGHGIGTISDDDGPTPRQTAAPVIAHGVSLAPGVVAT